MVASKQQRHQFIAPGQTANMRGGNGLDEHLRIWRVSSPCSAGKCAALNRIVHETGE
jgi:hypothetical protein